MSIASEITRINGNIAAAYTALDGKGATLPAAGSQNSANLADTIDTITVGGGGGTKHFAPLRDEECDELDAVMDSFDGSADFFDGMKNNVQYGKCLIGILFHDIIPAVYIYASWCPYKIPSDATISPEGYVHFGQERWIIIYDSGNYLAQSTVCYNNPTDASESFTTQSSIFKSCAIKYLNIKNTTNDTLTMEPSVFNYLHNIVDIKIDDSIRFKDLNTINPNSIFNYFYKLFNYRDVFESLTDGRVYSGADSITTSSLSYPQLMFTYGSSYEGYFAITGASELKFGDGAPTNKYVEQISTTGIDLNIRLTTNNVGTYYLNEVYYSYPMGQTSVPIFLTRNSWKYLADYASSVEGGGYTLQINPNVYNILGGTSSYLYTTLTAKGWTVTTG